MLVSTFVCKSLGMWVREESARVCVCNFVSMSDCMNAISSSLPPSPRSSYTVWGCQHILILTSLFPLFHSVELFHENCSHFLLLLDLLSATALRDLSLTIFWIYVVFHGFRNGSFLFLQIYHFFNFLLYPCALKPIDVYSHTQHSRPSPTCRHYRGWAFGHDAQSNAPSKEKR